MPALYAHYRFGCQALPGLDPAIQAVIRKHRRFYDMGLQGPDFLFYCHPLSKHSTSRYASQLHMEPGRKLFDYSLSIYRQSPSEEALAYLYGMAGHYALDAFCHPYVDRCAGEGLCSHSEIEAELDRAFLASDGIARPHAYDLSRFLTLKAEECKVFAPLYPGITLEQAQAGLRTMLLCYRALATPPLRLKRGVMRLIGHEDLMIPVHPMSQWDAQIAQLRMLSEQALAAYPGLLAVLCRCIDDGSSTGKAFAAPFQNPKTF